MEWKSTGKELKKNMMLFKRVMVCLLLVFGGYLLFVSAATILKAPAFVDDFEQPNLLYVLFMAEAGIPYYQDALGIVYEAKALYEPYSVDEWGEPYYMRQAIYWYERAAWWSAYARESLDEIEQNRELSKQIE